MTLISLLKLIFANFRKRKSRMFLTILGVSVAISAVLVLVSLGYGLQHLFLAKITTQGSLLTLNISPAGENGIAINDVSLSKIRKIKGVKDLSSISSFSSQIEITDPNISKTAISSSNDLVSQSYLNVVNSNFFSLYGIKATYGKTLNDSSKKYAVANASLATLMNSPGDELINKDVGITLLIATTTGGNQIYRIKNKFKIVGVVNDGSDNPQLYVEKKDIDFPITTYQSSKIKVNSSANLIPVRNKLVKMGFSVSSISDIIDQANKVFNFITVIFAVFGIVAVIVAAIGLINTMTISLLERTSQIGIMRAIGASPKDIRRIFLAESSVIGFLGGFVGIFLGIAVSQLFNWFINILARMMGSNNVYMHLFFYPYWFLGFIIIFSTIIGIIGGYFPARRAAKLNPLEALRYK